MPDIFLRHGFCLSCEPRPEIDIQRIFLHLETLLTGIASLDHTIPEAVDISGIPFVPCTRLFLNRSRLQYTLHFHMPGSIPEPSFQNLIVEYRGEILWVMRFKGL